MTTLLDRLRARPTPTDTVFLPEDSDEHERLQRALQAAEFALEAQRSRGAMDTLAERAKVAELQSQLDALPVHAVTLKRLTSEEWDALVMAHPPKEGQMGNWDSATFRPALLAACVVPGEGDEGLSEEDWALAAKDGALGPGELLLLFTAAINLNMRGPAQHVGKG